MAQTRVYWCCALAYVSLLSYGLSRSAVYSLLLEANGKAILPWAYGSVALAAVFVTAFYSRLAARYSIARVQLIVVFISALLLSAILISRAAGLPLAELLLYVWKDVYIVLLVELIWSLANIAVSDKAARWSYGLFCAAGSVGDMTGSALASSLAPVLGTANLLWLLLPNFALIAAFGVWTAKACGSPAPKERKRGGFREIRQVLGQYRYVRYLVILIMVIQVITTLIDFEYGALGEKAYPDVDDRTVLFARVDLIISVLSLALQLGAGLVLALLGRRLLTLLLPALVGATALAYAVHPSFLLVAILKITNKVIDYSLFRTSKELFYRPLPYAVQLQGKAAADVLGYRSAKGGASALLLTIAATVGVVPLVVVLGSSLWCVLALRLLKMRDTSANSAL
jgi:AAA family ATP:ADP antiporter